MKTKIAKSFTYLGLGFPVQLSHVSMVEVRGEYTPHINYNKLQKTVLLHLSFKKTPLTGNEIRFIRKYFTLTTTEFGELFGNTHSAVLKWEAHADDIARMVPTTEFYLRLHILEYLHRGPKDFKDLYHEINIPELAEYQKKPNLCKHVPLSINVKKELISAA